MRELFLVILAMVSFNSYAIDEKCKDRIEESLKTKSQTYLFEKYPNLIDTYVQNCSQDSFGDMALLYGVVFIHEATHFEDLGWQSGNAQHDHNDDKEVNIFLPDNTNIGHIEKTTTLPIPKEILRPLWKKNNKKLLKKDTLFSEIHEGYIGAEDSIAAFKIEGMATELNAYTHGLIFEKAIKKDFPEMAELEAENGQKFQYPNPLKDLDQIQGVYYFLYAFDDYFSQLEKNSSDKLNDFLTDANLEFFKKLFNSSIKTLNSINHCSVGQKEEKTKYWLSLIQNKEFSTAFSNIVGENNLKNLKCTNLESTIFDFENLNNDTEENDVMIYDQDETQKEIIIDINLKLTNDENKSQVIQN